MRTRGGELKIEIGLRNPVLSTRGGELKIEIGLSKPVCRSRRRELKIEIGFARLARNDRGVPKIASRSGSLAATLGYRISTGDRASLRVRSSTGDRRIGKEYTYIIDRSANKANRHIESPTYERA